MGVLDIYNTVTTRRGTVNVEKQRIINLGHSIKDKNKQNQSLTGDEN